MANLVDTSVNGDLRVTGTMFGTQAGNYATCATAAATAAKAVTISGFTLATGIHVFVKFTVTNTAAVASLTLNVSGTGAKAMKYRGGNLPAVGTLSASRVYEFIYDGTNWELVGDLDTNTQTVTGVKGNAESSYRTGQVNITPANIGVSATTTSVKVGDTTASIPQATTTTPKMDGTAAVGSETKWAKGDHVHPTDTSRAPTSHASSATTYGVGTTANYGHVKLDNSTPLTVGTTSTDGVATGKAHVHNGIESVARDSVTTPDIAHINTNTRVHMVLSQISSASGTTHDPGDGYMLTFMWDTTASYDSQLFIPGGDDSGHDFGRLRVRYRNNGSWGDWGYLATASQNTLINSSTNIDTLYGSNIPGQVLGYYWDGDSQPTGSLPSSVAGDTMLFVYTTANSADFVMQVSYRAGIGIYQRRRQGGTWGSWEKVLVSSDITTGTTNGTISVAGTDVAVKGLGGAAYLNTGTASGTVATGNHTHTTSIASDSSSGTVVTLAHNTQYKLTAGGTSVLFKTPADSNTDTKVTQTVDTSNDAAYPILAKNTTATATITDTSRFTSGVTLNPKNKSLTATTFIGALSGNATTATSLYKTAISYHRPVASSGDGKQWCRLATLTEANIASGNLWYGVGVVVNLFVNPYGVLNQQMHFGTYELVFRIGISAGSRYSLKTSGEMGIRRLQGPDRTASSDGRSGIDWKIVRSDTKVEFFIKNSEWDSALYIEKTQEVNGAGSRWVWKVENGLYTDDEFATYCSDKTTVDDTIRLTYKSNALVFPRKSSFNYDNWTQASSLITAEADYNGATNAPSTNWFYLLSMQGEDTAYAGQIAFRMTGDPGLFIRQRKSSAWQSWYRLLTTGDVTSTYSATGTSPVNGTAVASAISGKSPTSHTHTVKINGAEKTIAATGGTAVDLGTYLTAHQTIKQDGITGSTVNRFGTCSTAAATAAKTVSITTGTYSLEAGAMVAVSFTNKNTANSPTLAVGSTAAKNIFVNGAQITSGVNKGMLAGTVMFIYDGTQYHLIGNYYDSTYSGFVCGYCGTAAGTAAKEVYATNYSASIGNTILVRFTNTNSAAGALTLNAGGVTKTIKWNGTVTASGTTSAIPAGTWPCYYDGTYWNVWTNGVTESRWFKGGISPRVDIGDNGTKRTWASLGQFQRTGLGNATWGASTLLITHCAGITGANNKYDVDTYFLSFQASAQDFSGKAVLLDSTVNAAKTYVTFYVNYNSTDSCWSLYAKCPTDKTWNTYHIYEYSTEGMSNFKYDSTGAAFLSEEPSSKTAITGYISALFPPSITDNQVVLTSGINGVLKTSATSSLSVGTATNSTNSAVTADTTHQLYLIGATGSSGQQALKTDTGIYATATAGQLHATTFDVNSKCTLQFNTTTNALDFVFN